MLKKNDTVCFFGDSITAMRGWTAEIYDNTKGVKIYNCGVAGDAASRALERLYHDCLIYSPDYVVVMFGMNDIERLAYSVNSYDKEKIISAMELYKQSMKEIVKRCRDFGAEVILCTPTAYDEINDLPAENLCCNKGLTECAEFIKNYAAEHNIKVVDFNTTFNKLLKTMQLVMDDRVHPNDLGHHVMAQRFLKTLGIISEENFDKPFVMSERNEERYEIERKLRAIGFCEWCALCEEKKVKKMTIEEKKTILNSRAAANPKGEFLASMAAYYNECADFKDELLERLVELSFNTK